MIRNLFSWFSRRKFMGKDNYGNSYYEEVVPGRPRTRRTMTAAGYRGGPTNMSPAGYNSDKIPVQWRSWLSHTRLEPPTLEEIMADLQRQALVQQRAKQLDEQWRKVWHLIVTSVILNVREKRNCYRQNQSIRS